MAFRFACPECGLETLVDDEFAGHSGPCAGCGKTITVPHSYQPLAESTSATITRAPWTRIGLIAAGGIAAALFVFGTILWLVFPVLKTASNSVQKLHCHGNLERIATALKQYEVEHGTLPPAFLTDSTGKPMHSWRVLILPQLGYEGLYDRYNFTEPWDGPNNSTLIKSMPDEYGCPADPDARSKGETSYMVVVGAGTAFPGKTAIATAQIRDDHAVTILVAETPAAGVLWMQPKDLDSTRMKFAINGAMSGEIASMHREGANVITVDGTAHFLNDQFPEEYVEGMTTVNGGEGIPLESFD